MSKIIDLDILRPEPKIVKIGGKEIDVSFVPCGITFDLDAIVKDLMSLDQEKVKIDRMEMERAFGLGIKLCAVFCSRKYPEMDDAWFRKNTSPEQVNAFASAIQSSLMNVYSGITEHSKN